ncbi:MAG: metallophosphoesterase [Christensenellaceae bacterium]|jgi:putative phosphoesterase|nr:metallophosphoesterase [Christensenellaceae bacterium]
MKIIAFSDIHGNASALIDLIPYIERADKAIFLGDGIQSLEMLPPSCVKKIIAVRGNNDFFAPLPLELTIELGGVKFFLTHGNKYGVKSELDTILAETKERGCDACLFGHTHTFFDGEVDGVRLINVGAVCNKKPEFVKIEIANRKIIKVSQEKL